MNQKQSNIDFLSVLLGAVSVKDLQMRANVFVCVGKIALQNETMAKKCVPVFVNQLGVCVCVCVCVCDVYSCFFVFFFRFRIKCCFRYHKKQLFGHFMRFVCSVRQKQT